MNRIRDLKSQGEAKVKLNTILWPFIKIQCLGKGKRRKVVKILGLSYAKPMLSYLQQKQSKDAMLTQNINKFYPTRSLKSS